MGWTNQSINELTIGRFPTEIVLSTELPADLIAHYGTNLKSGILFYWNTTDYFYMISLITPGEETESVVFGANVPSKLAAFTEVMTFSVETDVEPAIATVILGPDVPIRFSPDIGHIPKKHELYVQSDGSLRYMGGINDTLIAPN